MVDTVMATSTESDPQFMTYSLSLAKVFQLFRDHLTPFTLQEILNVEDDALANINITGDIRATNIKVTDSLSLFKDGLLASFQIEEQRLNLSFRNKDGIGIYNIKGVPSYANNDEALANGLIEGDIYRTSKGTALHIVH